MEEGKDALVKAGLFRISPFRFLKYIVLFVVLGLGFSIFSLNIIRFFGVPNMRLAAESSLIKRCFEEPSSLEKLIRTPSLRHRMNDSELFWRASFVPRIKEYPFRRDPKIAFMFLTKGLLTLAPLWERFFRGHEERYSIYIHSHPSYSPNYTTSSVFYGRQIPSQIAEWGEMSMCDAERRLLANALLDISNEWFVLLSESCIPLQNFSTVYRYISRSHHSFMGSFDEDSPYGRGRYDWHMLPEVRLADWRKGAQWFEVDRNLAISIVQDNHYYPKFKNFCKPACYVDEHYFPTMLTIEVPHLLANRTLTWVDWSRGGAHPATYGKADISKTFFQTRIFEGHTCTYNNHSSSLCFLFARKFAPNALGPLLEIASEVFGF